jgi:hypothetical protein
MKSHYFFGWTNIKWFIIEIVKMYSAQPSYFSKKRIESGLAFIIAQAGMIFFLLMKYETMLTSEFLWWAAAEFAVSGYIINAIQKEKDRAADAAQAETPTETPVDTLINS